MNRLIQLKMFKTFIVLASPLVWYGLSSTSQAASPTNTSLGLESLPGNTTGTLDTGLGYQALKSNTVGNGNTATGARALGTNTAGNNNTATGWQALEFNSSGGSNTAIGGSTLRFNTGDSNTGTGHDALQSNGAGTRNTATGDSALLHNSTGSHNTGIGAFTLFGNQTGDNNTAGGYLALSNNTGSNNIALGANAGSNLTASVNNIDIGNEGVTAESNTIRIGQAATQSRTFIAGIRGVTTVNANAVNVVIDSAGQLGTVSSSRRFKNEIKPMDQASEAILALKPVTFHYKSDAKDTPQFGLIAEEVAAVNSDLVVRDADGQIYTVRYDAVNAMVLNEFLKEHRKVEEQEATITQLKKDFRATVVELNARLKKQDSKIEKVSAQIEASRPAPQTVANDQ